MYKTFTVPCKKYETVSFTSSKMKNFVLFLACSRFLANVICFIVLGSAPSAC